MVRFTFRHHYSFSVYMLLFYVLVAHTLQLTSAMLCKSARTGKPLHGTLACYGSALVLALQVPDEV